MTFKNIEDRKDYERVYRYIRYHFDPEFRERLIRHSVNSAQKNKGKLKEYQRLYREKNKEKLRQQRKVYRAKNYDIIKKKKKDYYKKNKDKILKKDREQGRLRYQNNKDKILQKHKNYRLTENGKLAMIRGRDKRRKKFPILLKSGDRNKIIKRDGMNCVYCKNYVFDNYPRYYKRKLVLDHVNPFGSTSYLNMVVACWSCNSSKNNKDVIIWCNEKGYPVPEIVQQMLLKQNKK